MNELIKEQWVAALRSGDYLQGSGALHRVLERDWFCCLGVLCELAVKAGVVQAGIADVTSIIADVTSQEDGVITHSSEYVGYGSQLQATFLPVEVTEWAGLISDPLVGAPPEGLSQYNDKGTPFPEIADLIEEWL